MNDVNVTTNDVDVAMELKSGTDSAIENWAKKHSSTISLTRLGLKPGKDISKVLNKEIENAVPGTVFEFPCVASGGNWKENYWRVDASINIKSGISFVGAGIGLRGAKRGGAFIYRSESFPVFKAEGGVPDQSEQDSIDAMISRFRLENLAILGGDFAGDLLRFRNVGLMTMRDCFVGGSMGRCLFIDERVQDSLFFNNRWEWGGTADGTVPMIEINNKTVKNGGATNNLVFVYDTMEAYRGTALKIHGVTTENIPAHWCSFRNIKLESNISAKPHIVMHKCWGIDMQLRTFHAHGNHLNDLKGKPPADSVTPCLIDMRGCACMDIKANVGISPKGRDVDYLIDMTGTTRSTVDLSIPSTHVIGKIREDALVKMDNAKGNVVRSDYRGNSKLEKKLTSHVAQPVDIDIYKGSVTATGTVAAGNLKATAAVYADIVEAKAVQTGVVEADVVQCNQSKAATVTAETVETDKLKATKTVEADAVNARAVQTGVVEADRVQSNLSKAATVAAETVETNKLTATKTVEAWEVTAERGAFDLLHAASLRAPGGVYFVAPPKPALGVFHGYSLPKGDVAVGSLYLLRNGGEGNILWVKETPGADGWRRVVTEAVPAKK